MSEQSFINKLIPILEDIQAIDVAVLDVKGQTSITDFMVICSGRSSRHVQAIAEHVVLEMKNAGYTTLGQTGFQQGDWALIDFGDVVVHVLQPESRSFYNLEGLWKKTSD